MVDISNNFLKFLQNNSFFNMSFNLSNVFILSSNLDNLFVLFANLFDSFHNAWNLNNLFNYILDISVDIDQLRNDLFNLNDSLNLHHLLWYFLDLVHLRNYHCLFNYLFDNLLSSYDFLDDFLNWDNLLSNNLDLFDLISYIWNLFNDLSNLSINDNPFLDSHELVRLRFNCVLADNLFNYCWNLNNLFNCFSNWNKFLNNSINWNRNLNWDDNLSFNLNNLRNFNLIINNFLTFDISWNLSNYLNDLLSDSFMIDNSFFSSL